MASRFSSAKNSIADCDRCGFRYKLGELKQLVIKTKNVNIKVCPECWEPDQPQLSLGLYPVNDPQAVRDPRPDTSYYADNGSRVIEWGWGPVGGARNFDSVLTPNSLVATGAVGSVIAGSSLIGVTFNIVAGLSTDDFGDYATGYGKEDSYFGSFGTATPTSVLGYPIISIYDEVDVGPVYHVWFSLGGLPADPGYSYFTSLTCNGHTLTSASATYFWENIQGPNTASWAWAGTQLGLVSGQTYTITLA